MARLDRVRSIAVPLLTTFVAGALIGVLIVASFGPALTNIPVLTGPRETTSARNLMVGFMAGDPRARGYVISHSGQDSPQWALFETTNAVGNRTLELKLVELSNLTLSPETLTHLGAGSAGPFGTDLYLVQLRDEKGDLVYQPFTVYTSNGQVVDVR
ncbi:MAG TPA: hypothetical protein VJZ72_01145 [Candidatus Limnocylindrales bacterium]|nr:hypothetical protein [Candidatus Limnocylindrales bacterium]